MTPPRAWRLLDGLTPSGPASRAPARDRARLLAELREMATHRAPSLIYALVLHHLFASRGEDLDEERIVRSATGIRDTVVWKKLFRFQRDGVVGAP